MERWRNKVAVVTGASAGIGSVCAVDLVKSGMKVVALARREDRLIALRNTMPAHLQGKMYPMKCDITNDEDVIKVFQWIEQNLGGVDVLVNNAGLLRSFDLTAYHNSKDVIDTINTNIVGTVYCVREAFQLMKKHRVAGHVVIVNSVLGHWVTPIPDGSFNIYSPSKHAVTAMIEIYRQEFDKEGTEVKITSVSPGAVETDMLQDFGSNTTMELPSIKAEDVSNAIIYCISTPPKVQVHELIIRPLHEKI